MPHARERITRLLIWAALAALVAFVLIPFLWMILSSLKSELEVAAYPATLVPEQPTLRAYSKMWLQENFVVYFRNSLIVALSTAAISTFVGALAGYGFSRFRFPGRLPLLAVFLGSQFIPGVLLVGPYFTVMSRVGLYDSLAGLILAQSTITLPFSIWMMKGFVDTVPTEVDEAALVDGASRARTFLSTILPNIRPGMVATVIFAFLLAWGDLLWALVLLSDSSRFTITLGITQLIGQFRVEWATVMAATVTASVPPAVLYALLQPQLVRGAVAGAIKG